MAPIAPIALNALNVARPVLVAGAINGAKIVATGAAIGVAYGVGFWTFGRTISVLNRRSRAAAKARAAVKAEAAAIVEEIKEACTAPDTQPEPLTQGGPANQDRPLPQAA